MDDRKSSETNHQRFIRMNKSGDFEARGRWEVAALTIIKLANSRTAWLSLLMIGIAAGTIDASFALRVIEAILGRF